MSPVPAQALFKVTRVKSEQGRLHLKVRG